MDGTRKKNDEADVDDRLKARVAKVTAYEKYKAQLHEFFEGKRELPEQLKDMLSTRPGAEEHGFAPKEGEEDPGAAEAAAEVKRRRSKKNGEVVDKAAPGTRRRVANGTDRKADLIAALRKSASPRESEAAIDAIKLEGMSLPLDLDLLSKALSHKDETVIAEALRGLSSLVSGPQTRGATLLKGRLQNVALVASSTEVRELCLALQSQLSG
jgi:hypothetical protein